VDPVPIEIFGSCLLLTLGLLYGLSLRNDGFFFKRPLLFGDLDDSFDVDGAERWPSSLILRELLTSFLREEPFLAKNFSFEISMEFLSELS